MSEDENKIDQEVSVLDEEAKKRVIKELTDRASRKGKKVLTYTEISNCLGDVDIDKDQMDEIYDTLIGKGG